MIVVEPSRFDILAFDASEIVAAATEIAELLGCAEVPVTLVIDERTPMTRSSIESVDPIVIGIEAGAIEDPRHIRHLHPGRLREVIARQLLGALDRRDPGYARAIGDDHLSLAQRTAWDAHIAGRLHRLGVPITRERWEHRFVAGHGHGPQVAAAFAALWSADRLPWDQLEAVSASLRPNATEPPISIR